MDSLNNTINALTSEGEDQKTQITTLQAQLSEKTRDSAHLGELLMAMESEPNQDGKLKVEVEDLKSQLKASQADLKMKQEEISHVQDLVRQEEEKVQQRTIDISRLNGQIQFLEEEKAILKSSTGDAESLMIEVKNLQNKLNLVIDELEVTREDNSTLSSELEQQQVLYTELKKMRGMGEELDLLQNAQRDLSYARERGDAAVKELNILHEKFSLLEADKMRLLREMAALKSGRATDIVEKENIENIEHLKSEPSKPVTATSESTGQPSSSTESSDPQSNETSAVTTGKGKQIGEKLLYFNIGSLQLFEIILGLMFISVVFSWHPSFV